MYHLARGPASMPEGAAPDMIVFRFKYSEYEKVCCWNVETREHVVEVVSIQEVRVR